MIIYGAIDAAQSAGGDVAVGIIFVFAFAIALVLALSLHEMSHALAAKINGDLTAAMYGRLSINPMRHFDPIGLVMMLLVGFGWAKPVPVDPRNFKNYRKGMLDVALSGVITNLIVAFVCSFFLALMGNWLFTGSSSNFVYYLKYFLYYTFGYSGFAEHKFRVVQYSALVPSGRLQGYRSVQQKRKRLSALYAPLQLDHFNGTYSFGLCFRKIFRSGRLSDNSLHFVCRKVDYLGA